MRAADAVAPNLAYPPEELYPPPILSPWHARSVAVAAAALLHAVVMLAAGAVFLSCCHYVRATGYGLARPSFPSGSIYGESKVY